MLKKKLFPLAAILGLAGGAAVCRPQGATPARPPDGTVVFEVLDPRKTSPNRLRPDAWKPWGKGFVRQGKVFFCDNGADRQVQRGASQTVVLNQKTPLPFVATVESRAENVGGRKDGDYSLHLDIEYMDGTHLWSQKAFFDVGAHDWQTRQVAITPPKPVRSVTVNLLLRRHSGKAWFRNPRFYAQTSARGFSIFDGQAVIQKTKSTPAFLVRDVAANSDFKAIEKQTLGLRLTVKETRRNGATFLDVHLRDLSGRDRAVTLYYVLPVAPDALRWLPDPRQTRAVRVVPGGEYMETTPLEAGAGKLSRYPLAAVAGPRRGTCLAIDPAYPAFYRLGYSAGIGALFLAYDLGFIRENPEAHLRFCRFPFAPEWGFRAALDRYYALFPEAFRCRTPKQGLWMPFAKISNIRNWQDFGFRFKEGTNETAWDDAHSILTFRYTETSSWWMPMPKSMPRTLEAAMAYARKLAAAGNPHARALLASGFYDETGRPMVKFRNAPWCDGAVWSMNSSPAVKGAVTDFKIKWNRKIKDRYYGPGKKAHLDGEYIDSSEGFVTGLLDFRRDHLAAAQTPLTFARDSRKPAQFCGLISFEYVRAIARQVHAMGKLMMANATPTRFCWLAPLMDVLGTETAWLRGEGLWQPMSDSELLYRRAIAKGKPYCFLMCADFHKFHYEFAEKYMKRALAYGMFPGFFSPEYSQRSHYFKQPEFYERDRPLFKRFVPLCRRVAEAGWEPIPLARSSDPHVYVERFGRRYLTVFNDSFVPRTVTVTLDPKLPPGPGSRELLAGRPIPWTGRPRRTRLHLSYEDVAVIDLAPSRPQQATPSQ